MRVLYVGLIWKTHDSHFKMPYYTTLYTFWSLRGQGASETLIHDFLVTSEGLNHRATTPQPLNNLNNYTADQAFLCFLFPPHVNQIKSRVKNCVEKCFWSNVRSILNIKYIQTYTSITYKCKQNISPKIATCNRYTTKLQQCNIMLYFILLITPEYIGNFQ